MNEMNNTKLIEKNHEERFNLFKVGMKLLRVLLLFLKMTDKSRLWNNIWT